MIIGFLVTSFSPVSHLGVTSFDVGASPVFDQFFTCFYLKRPVFTCFLEGWAVRDKVGLCLIRVYMFFMGLVYGN